VVFGNAQHPVDDIALHLLDDSNPLSEPPRVRVEVEVSAGTLRECVGEYQLAPEFSITITMENDALFGQATGQPRFAMFPESETRFLLRVVDAQITFERDERGGDRADAAPGRTEPGGAAAEVRAVSAANPE
jgi:serine-type D-Ala-D-Ala carboxypeptidase/endopeptidase